MTPTEILNDLNKMIIALNTILLGGGNDTVSLGGAIKPSITKHIENALSSYFAINGVADAKLYNTKANMIASSDSSGSFAVVYGDSVAANLGFYMKSGSTWSKTAWNPFDQVKRYADQELGKTFKARQTIAVDTLPLSSYTDHGIYYGYNNLNIADLPDGFDKARRFILINMETMEGGRFLYQVLEHQAPKAGVRWTRILDKQNIETSKVWSNSNIMKDYSITSVMMKDDAVNNRVLNPDHEFNGVLTSVSLNQELREGVYTCVTCTDTPSAFNTGMLEVRNTLGANFQLQRFTSTTPSSTHPSHWRVVRPRQSTPVWGGWRPSDNSDQEIIGATRLKDGSVPRAKLHNYFMYVGPLTSGDDLNLVDKDGSYVVTSKPKNAPIGAGNSGLLMCNSFNNGAFTIQKWFMLNAPEQNWTRQIRVNTSTPSQTEWAYSGIIVSENSRYANESLVSFGDSVTEFGDYPLRVGQILGFKETYNVGFGGCRMAKHESVKYNAMSMYQIAETLSTGDFTNLELRAQQLFEQDGDDNRAIVERLKSVDFTKVNYITIFYGHNDFAGNIPIGTDTDLTGDTFKGAMNLSIQKIMTKFPRLKLHLVTPYWRARKNNGDGLESDTNPNTIGVFLREYVEAMKEIGALYHIPVLDLHANSGINKYTHGAYLSDGLHPKSPDGYQLLADKISRFMS